MSVPMWSVVGGGSCTAISCPLGVGCDNWSDNLWGMHVLPFQLSAFGRGNILHTKRMGYEGSTVFLSVSHLKA